MLSVQELKILYYHTIAILFIIVLGFSINGRGNSMGRKGPLYFKSAGESVPIISGLLLMEDWITLSRYYHLRGSKVSIEDLESGRFFLREEKPGAVHPGVQWKYRHPFQPGCKYHGEQTLVDGTLVVTVITSVDQGDGMIQVGFQSFGMIRSPGGLQILTGDFSPHTGTYKPVTAE